MASRRRAAVLLAVLVLTAASCGDDDAGGSAGVLPSTTAPPVTADSQGLPPPSLQSLQAIFDPMVTDLGVRLTRGSVNQFGEGFHLALYVRPGVDGGSPEQQAERFVPLLAAVTPFVFETFPGLTSFDICQEPAEVEPGVLPPPETIAFVTREQAALVTDWETATLADVMRAVATGEDGDISASAEIEALPLWQNALAAAGTG